MITMLIGSNKGLPHVEPTGSQSSINPAPPNPALVIVILASYQPCDLYHSFFLGCRLFYGHLPQYR